MGTSIQNHEIWYEKMEKQCEGNSSGWILTSLYIVGVNVIRGGGMRFGPGVRYRHFLLLRSMSVLKALSKANVVSNSIIHPLMLLFGVGPTPLVLVS